MSRSRKRNPILKDNGARHRYAKKLSNQKIRAKTRNLLASDGELEDLIFPTTKGKELCNQYDVCDWWSLLSMEPLIWFGYSTGEQHIEEVTNKKILRYYRK